MTDHAEPDLTLDPTHIEEQMQLLEKGLRATQLYLPNNPVYQQAMKNLKNGWESLWSEEDRLPLKVTNEQFMWEGHPILHEPDRQDSIAWTLHKDGLRSITLFPGVEDDELLRLLTVINKVRNLRAERTTDGEEAEDDLLTLMWQEDFEYVHYDFVELSADEYPALEQSEDHGAAAPVEEIVQSIQEDVQAEPDPEEPSTITSMDDFDSTLYFLDPREIEYVKGEIDAEYEQDLHSNVLSMLFDILELQTYKNAREQILQVLERLIPFFLGSSDFPSVAYILSESRKIAEQMDDLDQGQRELLATLSGRLSEPQALDQLLQVLSEAHRTPTEEQLGELLRELRPESLETILTWIPRFTDPRVRNVLDRAVDPLARAHPHALGTAMGSPDPDVVTGALGIVIRLESQGVTSELGRLVNNQDAAVRLMLVDALKAVAAPTAMKYLIHLIEDTDRDVRMATVKALTERQHAPASGRIETIVKSRMKSADVSEKRAYFEAYGVLAGSQSLPFLKSVLLARGGLLKKKEDSQLRACAAMALGRIGSAEAKAVLEQLVKEKDPLVRNAVIKALREIRS